MKKILFAICTAVVLSISACTKSNTINSAFDLVQDNAPAEKVIEKALPIVKGGNLDDYSLEEKCKLVICFYYIFNNCFNDQMINNNAFKDFREAFSNNREHFEKIGTDSNEVQKAQEIYAQMTGTAKDIVDEYLAPGMMDY